MGITSSGLSSGINYEQLIQQVQEAQRRPVELLKTRQAGYQKEITAVASVSTKLSTLMAVASSDNNPANFNVNTVAVGKTTAGASLLTSTANSTATKGSYAIAVKQLAQAGKLAANGFVDQNASSVASTDGTFKFKVGTAGTEYNVAV
ncbi:MAG: hypothetical protein K8R65_06720, partial [Nitrospirae bacterium]|nr:hypothetical protein [Nitrospirota bacterium]